MGIVYTREQSSILINNQSIAASTYDTTNWFPCDGFDKLAINLANDASTSNDVSVQWSMDGSTNAGSETLFSSATTQYRSGITDTKAPWFRLSIHNGDTAAHVMTVWAYLKK